MTKKIILYNMPPTFPPLTSKGWKPSHRVTRCLCQSWWSWWRCWTWSWCSCWRWSWWSCFIMVKMIILIKMIVMTMILVVMRILKICSQFEIKMTRWKYCQCGHRCVGESLVSGQHSRGCLLLLLHQPKQQSIKMVFQSTNMSFSHSLVLKQNNTAWLGRDYKR